MRNYPYLLGFFLFSTLCHAFNNNPTEDKELENILIKLKQTHSISVPARLELITSHWFKRPYSMYCLGEGPSGDYDQRPLYRTDAFDCETFVDTALALANSDNLQEFKTKINQIRYHHAKVDFIHRNHFTNIDWNANNQAQYFIQDYTHKIKNQKHSLTKTNTMVINKKGWYQNLSIDRIFLKQGNESLKKLKLQELHAKAQAQGEFVSKLKYIPLHRLFNPKGQANMELFRQIPHGAIIEIVTPKSNTKHKIGTDLDISHMGFAFHKNQQVYFRHASFTQHQIVELPLHEYLKTFLNHASIKGIHIEMPLERDSHS
jgi:hypothetical protein